jgi:anti-sigma factor RsiW
MTQEWDYRKPTPEQLAAYADGQLPGPDRDWVESWLRDHHEAAAEVESYRRLAHVWETTSAPEPSPEAWDRTLGRIKDRLPGKRRALLTFPWGGLAGLAATAAILAAVLLPRPFTPPAPTYPGEEMPFPVATPHDVTIISMDAADIDLLVVARPPVELREIAFANHEDVRLIGQQDPDIRLEDWVAPMIVDPQAVSDREPGR